MTINLGTIKHVAISAAVTAEAAIVATTTTVGDWVVQNIYLIVVVLGGAYGYGRLNQKVDELQKRNVDLHLKVEKIPSSDRIDAIDETMKMLYDEIRGLRDVVLRMAAAAVRPQS